MKYVSLMVLTVATLALSACQFEADSTQRGQVAQEDNMQRAINAVPVPRVTNYPTRDAIRRYMDHDNKPDQTHYVYVMLPGVGYIGYYVADSAPVNICTAMTPPMRGYDTPTGGSGGRQPLGPAPGLDGVYYSGSSCDKWYFFDNITGAKIEVGGQMAFFVSSAPLNIATPQLTVKVN
jgi:hypothetical protein